MSYESRAYDEPARDGFGPDPVVVLVVKGTHDVSRLVNLLNGGPVTIEQMQVGHKVAWQVRQDEGGRAALKLLAEHGGRDFLRPSLPGLNEGALEVVRLLAAGKAIKEIARALGLSSTGVTMRLNRARAALGVRTREQLVALCAQLGLVEPGPPQAGSESGGAPCRR